MTCRTVTGGKEADGRDGIGTGRGGGTCQEKGITLSERQESHDFTHMWSLKNKVHKPTKQKRTHRHGERPDGCQKGRLEDWVKKVRRLKSTDWKLQNSHGNVTP